MRFDGSVSENLLGDFQQKWRLQHSFGLHLLNYGARSFSQHRKMHLDLAHRMPLRAKPSEPFIEVTTVLRCTVCKICE